MNKNYTEYLKPSEKLKKTKLAPGESYNQNIHSYYTPKTDAQTINTDLNKYTPTPPKHINTGGRKRKRRKTLRKRKKSLGKRKKTKRRS